MKIMTIIKKRWKFRLFYSIYKNNINLFILKINQTQFYIQNSLFNKKSYEYNLFQYEIDVVYDSAYMERVLEPSAYNTINIHFYESPTNKIQTHKF